MIHEKYSKDVKITKEKRITRSTEKQKVYNAAKMTDRAIIELLTSFFTASIPLLSSTGSILITVFEGMPYTLWNIRDLARHTGLRVARSFRFVPEAYPGYQHARTLGNIVGKNGSDSRGGWKGEDRESRMYAFVSHDGVDVIDDNNKDGRYNGMSRKKRKTQRKGRSGAKTEDSDSSSESD